jgi:formylglycine-generating enzyme required for sulfatase activity
VHIPAFCLGIHEVTVREYSACVAEGACSPGRLSADWPNLSLYEGWGWSRWCNHDTPDRQDHPMNCVDWYQADVYCRARGGRLPSEAEWEYAARGGAEQRSYPWGNEKPDHTRANCCGPECLPMVLSVRKEWGTLYPESDGFITTAPVGSFPTGAGRWGHLDLTCNVAEWTLDAYCPYDEPDCGSDERTVRGDGYQTCALKKVRAARRNHDEPWHRSPDLGLRCMRPLPGSSLAPPSIQPVGSGSGSPPG